MARVLFVLMGLSMIGYWVLVADKLVMSTNFKGGTISAKQRVMYLIPFYGIYRMGKNSGTFVDTLLCFAIQFTYMACFVVSITIR